MNVLVACEESQAVCNAFREKGHNAFSCDIQECSGGHPEWHIVGDCLGLINGNCEFKTQSGTYHRIFGKWDLIIAHPPCTYLTVTGNRWFDVAKYGGKAIQRFKYREDAIKFFMSIANADCEKIAIENPVGCVSSRYRKPDQIIHPYYFAKSQEDEDCQRKATCLWLKGLKPLNYEIKFKPNIIHYKNGKGTDNPWHVDSLKLPKEERSRVRSRTFIGIAQAMADQWGGKE